MKFNTRNWLLYIICVGVLVIGIITTAVTNHSSQLASVGEAVDNNETVASGTYAAEVVVLDNVLDRKAKLAAMREKVSQAKSTEVSSSEVAVAEISSPEDVVVEKPKLELGLKKCPWYQVDKPVWNSGSMSFSIVEGARILSATQPELALATTTSTTSSVVILQLPLLTVPPKVATCLPSDVVAVALDGSLIRNNEQGLYGIFSAATLLGYGLDGFPLYGKNDQLELDNCGGIVVDGQYRYYLQSKRETILNCFAGSPVKI